MQRHPIARFESQNRLEGLAIISPSFRQGQFGSVAKSFAIAQCAALVALLPCVDLSAQETFAPAECAASEEVILTCTIGSKTMSLCKTGADEIHYRFGKHGRAPELVYPEDSGRATDSFFWDSDSYAKGVSQYVTFRNGDYVYVVYNVQKAFSAVAGDTGTGVFVMRNGLLSANSFAAPGAGRVDEGIPPSIVGRIATNRAEIVVTSGRAPASIRVNLERNADGDVDFVHWKAREPYTVSDALLPVNVSLTRPTTAKFSLEYASSARDACESRLSQ